MEGKTIIEIANYAAPYKGNFISSLEVLEKKLASQNNRVIYIFPESCKKTPWITDFAAARSGLISGGGVRFVEPPEPVLKVFRNQKLTAQLKQIFAEEKPAIIHSHFDGYDEYCVEANTVGAEVIWHHHNKRELVADPVKRLYQTLDLRHQYGKVGKKAHVIIIGPEGQQEIERFGYDREAFLLPNGIREERISFAPKTAQDKITFLNFGGRMHQKGLDIFLAAVQILLRKGLDFRAEITEGTDTTATIRSIWGETPPEQIVVVPQIEDIQKRFHACDWFVSASRHETFSYAIAEAMLSGTPILSSRIDGVKWALEQPSVVPFAPENPEALAEKMEAVIQGKIKKDRSDLEQAREFVLSRYTTDKWADKLIHYYDTITEE